MSDVAKIASGLTDKQRAALINEIEWRGSGRMQFAVIDCLTRLPTPMVNMLTLRWDKLTETGLAVRAHLLSENPS